MSNSLMQPPRPLSLTQNAGAAPDLNQVDQRLEALEIKASFNEDLLEQLDQVVIRQQQQIDLLIRELTELRQPAANSHTDVMRSLRDDLPPHF